MDVGFKMPSACKRGVRDVKLGDRVPLVKRLQNPLEMDVDSVSVDQFRKHQLA